MQDLVENYEKYLVKEDDIIYEYNCIKCGGKCCINQDVLINPFDVWRIINNENVRKMLGVRTTCDLFEPLDGRKPLLSYYLGDRSRLPVACINMVELGENFTICPFNAPAKIFSGDFLKIKSMEDFLKLPFFKAADGTPVGLCALEMAKPTICRAYPLGRMGSKKLDKKRLDFTELPKMQYIYVGQNCEKFKVNEVTVKEYIKKWDLDKTYRMSDLVNEWRNLLLRKVPNERTRFFLGKAVFDFDCLIIDQFGRGVSDKELREHRPESFEILIATICNFIEDVEDGLEKVNKILKEKRGKIGRNDPCLCGSGKKYKRCCGK